MLYCSFINCSSYCDFNYPTIIFWSGNGGKIVNCTFINNTPSDVYGDCLIINNDNASNTFTKLQNIINQTNNTTILLNNDYIADYNVKEF